MSNLSTLKPFKKGADDRRNLKGRPVGSTQEQMFRKTLTKLLSKELKLKGFDGTNQEAMVQAIINKAIKGSVAAFNAITNITDGKPAQQKIEHLTPTTVYQTVEYRSGKRHQKVFPEDMSLIEKIFKDQGFVDVVIPE